MQSPAHIQLTGFQQCPSRHAALSLIMRRSEWRSVSDWALTCAALMCATAVERLARRAIMQNLTGSNYNSRSEFQLLSVLSQEFLRKTLEYDDCKSYGIAPAAMTYLAALHFASSQFQQTTRFCLAVIETSDMDDETLNAGCLLFID